MNNGNKLKKCYSCSAPIESGGGQENIFGQLLCWSCWIEIEGELWAEDQRGNREQKLVERKIFNSEVQ